MRTISDAPSIVKLSSLVEIYIGPTLAETMQISVFIQKRLWDSIASVARLCPLLAKTYVELHHGSVAMGDMQTSQ
jgi:hypothetical protein